VRFIVPDYGQETVIW